jgi:uncharacterized protein with HEPN domain
MPPTLTDRLAHILEAINDIQTLVSGKTLHSFADDRYLRMTVERALEIISEASRSIPHDVKARQADVNWLAMADLGNRLRHTYHRIDAKVLWQIVEHDLPPLKAFVERVNRGSKS